MARQIGALCKNLRFGFCSPKINEERFFRFLDIDLNYFDRVPWIFTPLKMPIQFLNEYLVQFHDWSQLPWWLVIVLGAFFIRTTMLPLILIQMRKFSKIAPAVPVLVFFRDTWRHSNLTTKQKLKVFIRFYRIVAKRQKFRLTTSFVYWAAYYPLLISMIFSVRRVISSMEEETFLHLTTLSDIDPFYILPLFTTVVYYYNFGKYITKENEHTLVSRLRRLGQIFFICWFPFMSSWPAGMVLYMAANALYTLLQGLLMRSQFFLSISNPKALLYMNVIAKAEYEPKASKKIARSILSGQEDIAKAAITQQTLIEETKAMLRALEKEQGSIKNILKFRKNSYETNTSLLQRIIDLCWQKVQESRRKPK